MTIIPDGIDAAAMREREFHPKAKDGKAITAWDRRAKTLKQTIAQSNALQRRLDKLEEELRNRPF